MTAFAAIVLADGQATPANRTFSPSKIDGEGIAKWQDRSIGIAVGFPTVTMSLREPTKTQRNYRLTRKIVYPVLEVTSPSTGTGIQPAPTMAFAITNISEWVIPERSTLAQRNDVIAFAKNFDATTTFLTAIREYESAY